MRYLILSLLHICLYSQLLAQIPAFACQTDAGFLTFDTQGKLCYNPTETLIQSPVMIWGNKMLVRRIVDGKYTHVICDFTGKTLTRLQEKNPDEYRIISYSEDEPFLGLAEFYDSWKQVVFNNQGKWIFETDVAQVKILGRGYFAYAKENTEDTSEPNLQWTIQHISGKKFPLSAYSLHPFEKNGLLAYETAGNIHFLKLEQGQFKTLDIPGVIEANISRNKYNSDEAQGAFEESKYGWTFLTQENSNRSYQIIGPNGNLLNLSFAFAQSNHLGITGITLDNKAVWVNPDMKITPISLSVEYSEVSEFQVNELGLVAIVKNGEPLAYTQWGKKAIPLAGCKSLDLSKMCLFISDDKGLSQVNGQGMKQFIGKYSITYASDKGFVIKNIDTNQLGFMNPNGKIWIPTQYDLIDIQDFCVFARNKKADVVWDIYNYEGKKIASDVFKTYHSFYLKSLNRSRMAIPD